MRDLEQLMRDVGTAVEDSRRLLRQSQALLDQLARQRTADREALQTVRQQLDRLRHWHAALHSNALEIERNVEGMPD